MISRETIFCAAGTLLLVTAGYLLPGGVFAYQDHKTAGQVQRYETERIQFQLTSQLSESLQLVGGDYTYFDLPVSDARLASEMEENAFQALAVLRECGVVREDPLSLEQATPILAVSLPSASVDGWTSADGKTVVKSFAESSEKESRRTAELWICLFEYADGGQLYLILDGTSGTMISCGGEYRAAGRQLAAEPALESAAAAFSDFCGRYYHFETLSTAEISEDTALLTLLDASDQELRLAVTVKKNEWFFNYPVE